jgi:hypothetical protein
LSDGAGRRGLAGEGFGAFDGSGPVGARGLLGHFDVAANVGVGGWPVAACGRELVARLGKAPVISIRVIGR